ncbi:hypothetical protein Tco_0503682 [Tanacetum coccineum]
MISRTCPQGREHRKHEIEYEKLRLLMYQVIDTPYSIDLNMSYGSSKGQYVVLSLQNTSYCLEEQDTLFRPHKSIRYIWVESLIRRIQLVDTPYQVVYQNRVL